MTSRQKVDLGHVQRTLLFTLYARALETERRHPLLRDPKAVEMVRAIDYDFASFEVRTANLEGAVLRTLMFDHWVGAFLRAHPEGTVVELGAGLNTRFERLDNGRVRWFDVDLPDSMALRRRFFEDSERRTMLAASVLDEAWVERVRASPGPYFFVAEGLLLYLSEEEARRALGLIGRGFPGASLAFDTGGRKMVRTLPRQEVMRKMQVSFQWTCDDPREVERWEPGFRWVESRATGALPREVKKRMPFPWRLRLPLLRLLLSRRLPGYRFSLFHVAGLAGGPL